MKLLLRIVSLWGILALLTPRVGYGAKTYVPGLALIARKLYRYITKHQITIQANVDAPTYTCVTNLLTCLLAIMQYLNKEAP